MARMHVHWKIDRLDDGESENPEFDECLLEIEGSIECDGQPAGLVYASYLFAEDPSSPAAFMDLWDLDGGTCEVFEEIIDPDHEDFREPLPELLDTAPGFLHVHLIALRPPFRRRGLGREVLSELVRHFADTRVGAVLLDSRPLQHRPSAYDIFDEEIRDLPWNPRDEDHARLMSHFRSWGMRELPGTRFMLAAPEVLCENRSQDWYPGLLCEPWDE